MGRYVIHPGIGGSQQCQRRGRHQDSTFFLQPFHLRHEKCTKYINTWQDMTSKKQRMIGCNVETQRLFSRVQRCFPTVGCSRPTNLQALSLPLSSSLPASFIINSPALSISRAKRKALCLPSRASLQRDIHQHHGHRASPGGACEGDDKRAMGGKHPDTLASTRITNLLFSITGVSKAGFEPPESRASPSLAPLVTRPP